eukprot:3262736-Alexandrium_andersonii.AAC.1
MAKHAVDSTTCGRIADFWRLLKAYRSLPMPLCPGSCCARAGKCSLQGTMRTLMWERGCQCRDMSKFIRAMHFCSAFVQG